MEHDQPLSPQQILTVADDKLGPLGYVVIDRLVRGAASGGVRFAPDVTEEELAYLARGMTYKWAFLNVPLGGAKAGIFADPQSAGCERETLMEAFGRAIAPLVQGGIFYPGVDLGTTLADLGAILRGAGRPLQGEQVDGSYATALTVFEAIRQAARFTGMSLKGLRVALEGFGKVAGGLAQLLAEAGASLVAVTTIEGGLALAQGLDIARLLSLREQYGDALVHHYPEAPPIRPEELYRQEADLLIPGARFVSIRAENAALVRARWIIPVSNAPLTAEAVQQLVERGVQVMPDFVANCGGVLASAARSNGFDLEDTRWLISTAYARVIAALLAGARRQGLPVGELARRVAWHNHLTLNEAGNSGQGRLARAAQVIQVQGGRGLWLRLAWRFHQRWPGLRGPLRQAALERFADMTLGNTLQQLTDG